MYQIASLTTLPNAQERIVIKGYVDCAKCIYLTYAILQIIGIIGSITLRPTSAVISVLWVVVFFVGVSKLSDIQTPRPAQLRALLQDQERSRVHLLRQHHHDLSHHLC